MTQESYELAKGFEATSSPVGRGYAVGVMPNEKLGFVVVYIIDPTHRAWEEFNISENTRALFNYSNGKFTYHRSDGKFMYFDEALRVCPGIFI